MILFSFHYSSMLVCGAVRAMFVDMSRCWNLLVRIRLRYPLQVSISGSRLQPCLLAIVEEILEYVFALFSLCIFRSLFLLKMTSCESLCIHDQVYRVSGFSTRIEKNVVEQQNLLESCVASEGTRFFWVFFFFVQLRTDGTLIQNPATPPLIRYLSLCCGRWLYLFVCLCVCVFFSFAPSICIYVCCKNIEVLDFPCLSFWYYLVVVHFPWLSNGCCR